MARVGSTHAGLPVKLANKSRSKGKNKKKKNQHVGKRATNASRSRHLKQSTRKPVQSSCKGDGRQEARGVKRTIAARETESSSDDDCDENGVLECEKKVRLEFQASGDEAPAEEEVVDGPATPAPAVQAAAEKQGPSLSLIEVIAGKRQALEENKSMVGGICVSVIANPSKNLKKLKSLLSLLDLRKEDPVFKLTFLKLQSLVAYSLLEVFKDILPEYRIREDVEEEVFNKKLKKETRELRQFEASLLKYYRTYISKLQRMTESVKRRKSSSFYDHALPTPTARERIAVVGLRCLSSLMLSHPTFNFSQLVVDSVVPLMSSRVHPLREIAFDAVTRLFREDKTGQASMMAVKSAGKIIKALKLNVHPLVIKSFLFLRIKEVEQKSESMDMKAIRDRRRKQSKMERKHEKELLKLKNELKEADACEDQAKKLAIHTQILNQIFFVYFRFIRDFIRLADQDFAKNSAVMTPVLQGLSKFAHLINIDFFDDLIALLFRLIACQRLSDLQTLFCLNTVFTILSGEGSAVALDPSRFYARLYALLLRFDVCNDDESLVEALVDCLRKMLLQRKKQLSLARVLAFCKRIASFALQTSSETSAVSLTLLRSFMQDHAKSELLLDSEQFGSGSFLPEVEDPEFCHADATRLWELHLLRRHFDPFVRSSADLHLHPGRTSQVKNGLRTPEQVHQHIRSRNRVESVFSSRTRERLASFKRKNNASVDACFLSACVARLSVPLSAGSDE